MQNIKSINCPNCGAPLEWINEMEEMKCPFCGSILSNKQMALQQVKDNNQVIDLNMANIDQLHDLEQKIGLAKKFQIKYAGHKLLMNTLGDKYEQFIKDKKIDITGNNGKTYVLHINGYIECYKKYDNPEDGLKKEKDGQLVRNGYPASDAFVTFITYARADSNKLDALWGCGNIKLTGGTLQIDGRITGRQLHEDY